MPVRKKSALYNDPAIGAIFDNLGSMFAPQKATDIYAYAKARAEQQAIDLKNAAATALRDPNASVEAQDRAAALAQLYNPTQGFGARNMNDATTRRGQDITASTSLANTSLQEKTKLEQFYNADATANQDSLTVMSPRRAAVMGRTDPVIRGNVSLAPGERVVSGMGGPVLEGAAKPLTDSEQKAIALAALKPDEQRMVAMQGVKTGNYVGPGGLPITAFDTVAADQGMAPAAAPIAPNPTFRNYMNADGKSSGLMTVGANGKPIDATTGQEIAPGAQLREIQGSAADTQIGGGTKNKVDQQLLDLSVAEQGINQLEKLTSANPAAQGIAGQVRGTAQDLFASGSAIGQLLNSNMAATAKDIAEGRVDKELVGQLTNYDPAIPKIVVAENNLIAQMAKLQSGDSRVSNDRFNQLKASLGSGWLGNAEKTKATMAQFREMIAGQRAVLGKYASDPSLAESAAAPPPAPVVTGGPREGDIATNADGTQTLVRRGGKWVTQQ